MTTKERAAVYFFQKMVKDMRQAQKYCFKKHDATAVRIARDYERRVDALLRDIEIGMQQEQQLSMLGGRDGQN